MDTQTQVSKGDWSLPIIVTKENKYFVGAAMFGLAYVLYATSNHFHLVEPVTLHMTWVDRVVPFVPLTVWIYVSEYLYFGVIYIICKDMGNLNKYLYSFFVNQFVSILIFWVWPTTYPRDLFPLPDTLDPITHTLFSALRVMDSPANCCPSLHVSSVYLSSFIFFDEQRRKLPFFLIWGTAIALSTLTTKQHYLIDVIVGFFMAVGSYWIFHRLLSYRTRWLPSNEQARH